MSPRLPDVLLRSQSDERLVGLARAGHERAFVVIVERYRPELQALARRLCSDGRSEDIVQQAFLSAYAALSTGCEVRHLRGWLYQILRNAANRPAGPLCVPLDGATASASNVEDVVQQRALAMTTLSELSRLPSRQRQAMIGTALDGRARADVARSMGLSEGAVRQLVHRARTTLRGAVTAITPWPLAQWTASAASGGGSPGEVVAGAAAGAASTGGFLSVKLGIVVASGAIATGVAAVGIHGLRDPTASRPTAGAGAPARHPTSARRGVGAVDLATVASATGSPEVVTPAVVSRVVLRQAAPGAAEVIALRASRRSGNASHGVPARRSKGPGGANTRTGERHQPPDGAGRNGGGTETGAVPGGGRHTPVTDGAVGGRGDGSGAIGGGASGRQDGGGDQSAGRSDGSGSGRGVDRSSSDAYTAGSSGSGSGSDAGDGGNGGALGNSGGSTCGGGSCDVSGSTAGGSTGGGGGSGVGGSGGGSTGSGGGSGDTGQLASQPVPGAAGNSSSF